MSIKQVAGIRHSENVRITVRDLRGNILEVKELHNIIPTVDLNMVRDAYYGDVTDCEIKYMGVGSDDGTALALAATNTTLGTETFRKLLTDHSKPADGQILTTTYIAPAEAVGWIKEIGWFSGVGAVIGFNTGILSSRIFWSRNKTNIESVQVERTLTIAEA
ncbi:MAG: hypothetical protein KKH61_21075 [Gammaproteobacteria bacterium]|nr:hypothetical protein [Gammaproteobacteria bacterium]